MDMIGRIRRLHSRDKKSEREISRLTGLSSKLTAFHEVLKQALSADAHRARHERRTALALYGEIKAAGYEGGYTRVTDLVREWRQGEGRAACVSAFVPLAFELGEAFQFDWSEEGLVVGASTTGCRWRT